MIGEKEVERIATLARLSLTEQETKTFARQLSSILEHFKQIAKIDTQGVEPLVTPTEMPQNLRADKSEQWAATSEALKNAPEKSGNLFKVPPVV